MRLILLVLSPFCLSGCFLPAWVTYASFVADGVSLIAMGKSTTDLALSAAAEQDCAMWRILEDGMLCQHDGVLVRPGAWPMTVVGVSGNDLAGAPTGNGEVSLAPDPHDFGMSMWSVRPSVDGDRPYESKWPVQFMMEPPTST